MASSPSMRPAADDGDEPEAELPVGDQIDFDRIAGWLAHCDAHHGPACRESTYADAAHEGGSVFLVDVADSCVVESSLREQFVALSYVWGGVEQLSLLASNLAELKQPGSLQDESRRDQIPRTIRDAMTVARAVGQRYLWVDTLCIMQDDPQHKQTQLGHMAEIYSRATFTIVACTAQDANSPLPGVSPNTRLPHLLDITDMDEDQASFAKEPAVMLGGVLVRSPHGGRAWTFQEVVLSKRCLFFLGSMVYLQCQGGLRKEHLAGEAPHGPMNQAGNWPPLTDTFPTPQLRYNEMVHTFTRRKLTYAADRLHAFTGLLDALRAVWGWSFAYALPEHLVDWAVLWVPEDRAAVESAGERTLAPPADFLFPSWSWLSHPGACYYLLEQVSKPLQSYVDWSAAVVWDGERTRHLGQPADPQGDDSMAGLYRSFPAGTMTAMGIMAPFAALGRLTQNAATDRFEADRQKFAKAGQVYTPLATSEGKWCGTLIGIGESHLRRLLDDGEELSLFLLSSAPATWVMGGFRRPIPCFDHGAYKDGEYCTVNVILISTGERPYRRLAVGEVHRDEWNAMGGEPDLIWLA